MNKKLPPYGRYVTDLKQSQKIRNGLFVYIGDDSWDYAKWERARGNAVLALPPDGLPHEYKWDLASNLDVLVVVTSSVPYELVRRTAYELLKANAFIVHVVNKAGVHVTFRQGEPKP